MKGYLSRLNKANLSFPETAKFVGLIPNSNCLLDRIQRVIKTNGVLYSSGKVAGTPWSLSFLGQ